MKLIYILYSVTLFVICPTDRGSNQLPKPLNVPESKKMEILNDQWPFEDTLKQKDPYISELLQETL